MAKPVINESLEVEYLASGSSYSRTFTATGTPTGWTVTGAPSGWTINDGTGELTGTVSEDIVTAYTASVTAENADGTSEPVSFVILVLPSATGSTSDDFSKEINFDLLTGLLSIPGISTATAENEEAFASFISNERYELAIGADKRGLLQNVTLSGIDVTLRRRASDTPVLIGSGTPTSINTTTDRRFEQTIFIDEGAIAGLFQRGSFQNSFEGFLQLKLESSDDDRAFASALVEETIASMAQGATYSETLAPVVGTENDFSTAYLLTVKLVSPSDTGLEVTLTKTLYLTYTGTTYVLDSESGADSGTGSSTVADDWDTTLSINSLAATTTGVTLDAEVVTSAQTDATKWVLILTLQNYTVESSGGLYISDPATGDELWSIRNASDVEIFEWDGSAAGYESDVKSAFETGTGETVSVTLVDGAGGDPDQVIIEFADATAVAKAVFVTAGASSPSVDRARPVAGPVYTDTKVTAQLTGLPMPERSKTRKSLPAKVEVIQSH